ncbi:lysophospholipase [Veronia nyctiphanis]|uniref:Lysophospholipase n=1 Tax=Veronia nyctiphanis TaxID=1278244 RepID=A0A4Q0YV67_9GAMM|nr:alpha/beta fold hydrolase [Veronia nyctiphanis]RXJ73019.1 lysophospholipase [Veronia nyctiphanis]
MTTSPQPLFTSEADFLSTMASSIESFWHQRDKGFFTGKDGLRIHWCSMTDPSHTQAVIIVNGRAESTVKYQELMFDLFRQGYDVYSHDHRGQGHSERLLLKSDAGHIDRFDDYVDDLDTFINNIVSAKDYSHRFLLSHSMGGAVATLYGIRKPAHIDAIVLSAPMFGIQIPAPTRWIAQPAAWLHSSLQHPPSYALGQGPYDNKSFTDNVLTHSEVRYHWFRELYEVDSSLKVGGPTPRWVWQSLEACRRCQKAAEEVSLPMLLLQAMSDSIVSNDAISRFVTRRQNAGFQIDVAPMAGSRHEILFEVDPIRQDALSATLAFFKRHAEL